MGGANPPAILIDTNGDVYINGTLVSAGNASGASGAIQLIDGAGNFVHDNNFTLVNPNAANNGQHWYDFGKIILTGGDAGFNIDFTGGDVIQFIMEYTGSAGVVQNGARIHIEWEMLE